LNHKVGSPNAPRAKIVNVSKERLNYYMSRIPVIDEESCIGCNACVEVCPGVFVFNDTLGWAMVMFPDGAPEEKIQEAIDICPVHCIDWVE
jgi:ferredoxin